MLAGESEVQPRQCSIERRQAAEECHQDNAAPPVVPHCLSVMDQETDTARQ